MSVTGFDLYNFLHKKTPCYFYVVFYVSVQNPKHTVSLSLGNNFVSLRVMFSVFTKNVSSFHQCFLRYYKPRIILFFFDRGHPVVW